MILNKVYYFPTIKISTKLLDNFVLNFKKPNTKFDLEFGTK